MRTPSVDPSLTTYCSISAQEDNLGDIVIRQAMLDWLGALGHPLTVFTGQMSDSYVRSFRFPAATRLAPSASAFEFSFLRSALRGSADLVFAPGPVNVAFSIRGMATSLQNLANVLVARGRGGKVSVIGRAFRGDPSPRLNLERIIAKRAQTFLVRDDVSAKAMGGRAVYCPDLGFYSDAAFERTSGRFGVMSFRNDRPVDAAACSRFSKKIEDAGMEPILLTQVRRDDDQHERLANELGIRHLAWGSRSHSEQLTVVTDTYLETGAVFSNRLHSLVLGARHGAVPIALREPGHDKLEATLGPILSYVYSDEMDSVIDDLDGRIAATSAEVEAARRRIVVERDAFITRSRRAG